MGHVTPNFDESNESESDWRDAVHVDELRPGQFWKQNGEIWEMYKWSNVKNETMCQNGLDRLWHDGQVLRPVPTQHETQSCGQSKNSLQITT